MVVCKPFMRPCEDGLSPSWMVFGGSSSQLGAQTNHQCIGEIHKWPEDSHRKEKTQPPFTSVSVIFHAKYFVVGKKTCFPAQKSCMEMAIIKHSTGTIIYSEPWIRQRISARTGPGRSPLFSRTWEGDSVQQSPCIQDWLLTRIRTDHQHLQHQQIWLSWTFASSLLPDCQGKVQERRSWRIQTSSVQHPILLQKHGPSMTHVDPSRPRVCSVCSLSRFRIRRWWWEHGRSQRRPGLNQLDPAGSKGMCRNLETCHSTTCFAQCFSTLGLSGIIRHPCMGCIAGAEALTLATRVSMRDLQNCYIQLHDSVVEARHNQPHSLKHRFSRYFQRSPKEMVCLMSFKHRTNSRGAFNNSLPKTISNCSPPCDPSRCHQWRASWSSQWSPLPACRPAYRSAWAWWCCQRSIPPRRPGRTEEWRC